MTRLQRSGAGLGGIRSHGRPRQRFHSVADAALILGMSEATLYRAIHAGGFPAVKVRGRYVIPACALDAIEQAAAESGAMVDAATWPMKVEAS